ncbi:FAD-dependent monooxygenase [Mycolicibacterium sp. P1-18]|uniref:FAD-dependent monooxygenase n=1 Tax=Mycolicibacterium sp. P1-18 TaxID=2024615 RepID=UPI00210799B9|nr:FAD-dependent monooxygenase [Mycolicibacterium sp. P1-18]
MSGAGIAGPVLAHWLVRFGFAPTIVERAPELRDSGQNVDVRGIGREVLQRMGLEERVRASGTGEVGLRFVDDRGRSAGEFPVGDSATGDGPTAELEILRSQLSRLLVDEAGDAEFVFGDRIESVEQDEAGVDVTLAEAGTRRFDLLIVAEGIRSTTRNAVFGGEPDYRDLGFYTAYCTVPRIAGDDQWWQWYTTTGGRSIHLRPDNVGSTRASLNFRCPPDGLDYQSRDDQVRELRRVFGDVGNAAPRILDALSDDPSSLYLDRIAQVRMPAWSKGRVAVVGDAAYCATPVSGMGTSLALAGAYLLAGALGATDDHAEAFASYERYARPFVDEAQKLPPGVPRIANPTSRLGVRLLRTATRVAASAPARALTSRLTSSSADRARVLPDFRPS